MKAPQYIRCPRCELNYIQKKDKFCAVCKKEMQVGGGDELDDLDLELCPVCKTNYIQPDEIMCATCIQERELHPELNNDDWDDYIKRDEDEIEDESEETGDYARVTDLEDDDLLDTDIGLPDDDDDLTFGDAEDDEDDTDDEEDDDNDIDENTDDLDEDFDDIDELDDDDDEE